MVLNKENKEETKSFSNNIKTDNKLSRKKDAKIIFHIQPIEKLVLIDQIIETISKLIAEGQLSPGDALPSERDLSLMLKVSRTSVRQALKALDILGVLEIKPGSRTYMNRSISKLLINPLKFMTLLHDLDNIELFETRKIIEVALTKLAVENASETDLENMRDALIDSKNNLNDPRKYINTEMDFHNAIFEGSGNRMLFAFMQSLDNLLIEAREKTVFAYLDLEDSLQQHTRIFDAIKERDPDKAGKAMLDHLIKIEKSLIATKK